MAQIQERLDALRQQMKAAGVFATIFPQTDPHQSEYIADHWQVRRYLSGFTGSAGSIVVTANAALLWADSRYFIQAAQQLQGTEIILMKDGLSDTPSITQYLCQNVPAGATVGLDGMLFSHAATKAMAAELAEYSINLTTDFDPIDAVWTDRPSLPKDKIFVHDIKYAGQSAADKIAQVMANARSQHADSVLIVALDEIAWTLNIRSTDVNCNPVATAFLFLSAKGSYLFTDADKLDATVIAHLKEAGVEPKGYNEIIPFLESLKEYKVLVEENRLAQRLWTALGDNIVTGSSTVALLKGCKNQIQLKGVRNAMERDGVALIKSFMEIEQRLADGVRTTEIDVADILKKYRSQQDLYFDISFETIAGYGAHGAIVHYSATPQTDVELRPEGLLLVDSGAQYLDGTTDITRTVSLGNPTQQEKDDFTLVLKGHIALGTAIYPEGTRGAQLDALARIPLWQHGLSYLHGTGHGVGHFLNVHEGPQSIRLNENPITLMPGMITSNEPGLYREGIHGIRCENLVLTTEAFTTEFGHFYKFETLTLFPFDTTLVEKSLLSDDELKWLNDYNATVYNRLSPALNDQERQWLRNKTLPI
jgi:Xaa-Pro aminopeptidase